MTAALLRLTQSDVRPLSLTPTWRHVGAERGHGFVIASQIGQVLRIQTGDPYRDGGEENLDRPGGLLTADLEENGSAVVETTTALPAILISPDGARILPAERSQRRPNPLAVGERLILCCASPTAPPRGYLRLFEASASLLLSLDLSRILKGLLNGVTEGAAAVISRSETTLDLAPPHGFQQEQA